MCGPDKGSRRLPDPTKALEFTAPREGVVGSDSGAERRSGGRDASELTAASVGEESKWVLYMA